MKDTPKYNSLQNSIWAIRQAWSTSRVVPFLLVGIILLDTAQNIVTLCAGPLILSKVEQGAPLKELIQTLLLVTALLFVVYGLRQYSYEFSGNRLPFVSRKLTEAIINKQCATSYPNALDAKAVRLRERASSMDDGEFGLYQCLYSLTYLGSALLRSGTAIAMLSRINVVLVLICVTSSVVNYIVLHKADEYRFQRREEEGKYKSRLSYIDRKAESVTLAKDIRMFGLAGWLTDVHTSVLRAYEDFVARAKLRQLIADLIIVVMTVGGNGLIYALLCARILRGELSAAEFLLYFSAANSFGDWLTDLMNQLTQIHRCSLEISALREYLELPEPFLFEEGAPVPASDGYEIRLEDVSYRYPQAETDILTHVNLVIHPGEKLAIVGLNGAGKTTLVRLISGLLDPTEGRVLLNRQDVRTLNRRACYELFSAVFQDYSILDVTIAENIAMCPSNEINRDRVTRCLELAGLAEKIETLPKGMDAHVGREIYEDGVLLSGGETQRLIMARALYKNGPILLLDEPTAALDPLAEHDIYTKYNQMTSGRTALFISHRLASTRFCDRILFISDGGIAEEGTHDELIARGGQYRQMFDIQSRYYREGVEF